MGPLHLTWPTLVLKIGRKVRFRRFEAQEEDESRALRKNRARSHATTTDQKCCSTAHALAGRAACDVGEYWSCRQ